MNERASQTRRRGSERRFEQPRWAGLSQNDALKSDGRIAARPVKFFAALADRISRAVAKSVRCRRSRKFEALIGDHDRCGMTRQQYRSRLRRLQKWNLITTRTTYRGTVARLNGNEIFDIGLPSEQAENGQKSQPAVGPEQARNWPPNQPADSRGKTTVQQPPSQPTANQQPTSSQPLTKKEIRKEGNHDDDVAANSSSFTILEDAKQHPLWPDFASWCRSKNGRPLVAGFNTWLRKQPSLPEKSAPRANGSNYQRLLTESQARADAENGISTVRNHQPN